MMTGIPIENSIWSAYLLTAFLVIVGFAFYDIFHRRVPDRALVFFIPLAAAAPLLVYAKIRKYKQKRRHRLRRKRKRG